MKKLLAITLLGAVWCVPASAAGPANVTDGLGAVLNGLSTSLQEANLKPLIDGLAGPQGLVQGGIGVPLNNTLTGLLVNVDPNQFATGLQNTLTLTVNGLAGALGAGNLATPALSSQAIPGANSLSLPGLQGGEGFSDAQMQQANSLLAN